MFCDPLLRATAVIIGIALNNSLLFLVPQWGAVEREPRQYNWQGYKQLFEMLRGTGLRVQVVLAFHACGGNVGDVAQVPLPAWVLQVPCLGVLPVQLNSPSCNHS